MIYAIITLSIIFTAMLITGIMQLRIAKNLNTDYYYAKRAILGLFLQPDAETASEFAQIINSVATIGADRLTASLKATLMQSDGAIKRQENKLKVEAVREAISSDNPIAGLIMSKLPKSWLKDISEHPSTAIAAFNLAKDNGWLGALTGGGSAGGNGQGESYADMMSKLNG